MAKELKYFIKFRLEVKELTQKEFIRLYELMVPRLRPEEREALRSAMLDETKNDHVTIMFDPNDEEGYKNTILRILE